MLRTECSYEGVELDLGIMRLLNTLEMMFDRDMEDDWMSEEPRMIHGIFGVDTEIGELRDAFKKVWFYRKPLDVVNVLEEIGDVLWYVELLEDELERTFYGTRDMLDTLARKYDSNLEECRERVINKLKVRYPDKFTNEGAETRDLAAERKELETN